MLLMLAILLLIRTPNAAGGQSNTATPQPEVFQTLRDGFPNFARQPTLTTRRTGPWSSPGTWAQNRIPRADDVVLIQGPHSVTYPVECWLSVRARRQWSRTS